MTNLIPLFRKRFGPTILMLWGIWLLTACSQPTASEPPAVSDPQISAPTPQEPGQEVGISVDVASVSGANLSYEWRVDGGEIVRGQGSPAITYRTPDEPGIYNVRVAVMWDDSSVEKITTIRVEAPEAEVASADEPPTATPTPEPAEEDEPPTDTPRPPTATRLPTNTPQPTNTPSPKPTNTPRPTPTPTATIDSDPTVYDNFNNPAFDGSFNRTQWTYWSDPPNQIEQRDGILVITKDAKIDSSSLAARKYDYVSLNTLTSGIPTFFESKLMLDRDQHANGNVQLHLSADLPIDEDWFSECIITDTGEGQVWANCWDILTWKEDHEYAVEGRSVDYGTWHTFRIEVDPETMNLTYYIDGQMVGAHVPVDAEQLKNAKFTFSVGVWSDSPDLIVGYIDDVRIGRLGQ